jgi:hypothetical protein
LGAAFRAFGPDFLAGFLVGFFDGLLASTIRMLAESSNALPGREYLSRRECANSLSREGAAVHEDDSRDAEWRGDDLAADTEATVPCPYCGEAVELALDPAGGDSQAYVEDCQVCCRPWQVRVRYDRAGRAHVTVSALDE